MAANWHLACVIGLESEDDFIGHTDFELLPRRLAEKYRRNNIAIMNRLETSTKIVDLIMNRQGISSWFITSIFPIIFESDEVLGVIGIIQDYHQHRKKFPAEQELKKALSHIHHHFWEKIAISEFSKTCDLSLRQFERKFK